MRGCPIKGLCRIRRKGQEAVDVYLRQDVDQSPSTNDENQIEQSPHSTAMNVVNGNSGDVEQTQKENGVLVVSKNLNDWSMFAVNNNKSTKRKSSSKSSKRKSTESNSKVDVKSSTRPSAQTQADNAQQDSIDELLHRVNNL